MRSNVYRLSLYIFKKLTGCYATFNAELIQIYGEFVWLSGWIRITSLICVYVIRACLFIYLFVYLFIYLHVSGVGNLRSHVFMYIFICLCANESVTW